MTITLDSSALLKRYLMEPGHELVNEYLTSDPIWCASALARTEVPLALHRVASGPEEQRMLWSTFREDWERVAVVPTDQRCLARAVELGATFQLGTVDALHLAAADRLPRPLTYLTFDSHQIPAALGIGFEVVSTQGSTEAARG